MEAEFREGVRAAVRALATATRTLQGGGGDALEPTRVTLGYLRFVVRTHTDVLNAATLAGLVGGGDEVGAVECAESPHLMVTTPLLRDVIAPPE